MNYRIYVFIAPFVFMNLPGCQDKGNLVQHENVNQSNLSRVPGISNIPSDSIYNQCSGTTIFPGDSCTIPDGLGVRVFNEWKSQFITQHGISDSIFNSRIKLSNVELTDGPDYVFLRIEYVFVLDWVRSRQSVAINLGSYPLTQEPTESAIWKAVSLQIRAADQINMNGVVPLLYVERMMRSCDSAMKPDWCQMRFENVTGRLLLHGRCTIDFGANACKEAVIDLSNGELVSCHNVPCWIN